MNVEMILRLKSSIKVLEKKIKDLQDTEKTQGLVYFSDQRKIAHYTDCINMIKQDLIDILMNEIKETNVSILSTDHKEFLASGSCVPAIREEEVKELSVKLKAA